MPVDAPRADLPIEAVLLAAGASRRMAGRDKLLLSVDGVPLVRRSAMLYLALGLPLIVVIAADAARSAPVVAALAGLRLRIVANPDPGADQAGSALVGLAAAALAGRGVVVALADQPLLTSADIAGLIARFDAGGGAHICIPRHAGMRGNPVVMPIALARMLRDDPAAPRPRAFIDAHADRIDWLDIDHPRFTRDIDTPQDAAPWLAHEYSDDEGASAQ